MHANKMTDTMNGHINKMNGHKNMMNGHINMMNGHINMMNGHINRWPQKPEQTINEINGRFMLQYIEAKWMHITNPHEKYEDKIL